MASEEDTERRPLLGDVSVAQDVADIPSETPAARRQRIIYVALIGIIVNSTVIVTSEFVTAAMSQLVEGAACQKLYPDITDPYVNKRCKNEPVQAELSFVIGWDTSIGMLPGLLTAIPFGIFAEKYGPRALLIVGLFGQFFNQLVVLGVCLNPLLFDIRWIWSANLFSFIGGGEVAFEAMRYSIASCISTKSNRATVFLYLEAMSSLFRVILGPLVYAALERGPVLTECIGAAAIGIAGFITFALPRDIGMVTSSDSDELEEPGDSSKKTSIFLRAFVHLEQILEVLRQLLRQNDFVGILLFSLIITTIGEMEGNIRRQYAAKRYDWSWSTVALINSTTMIVSTFVMLVAIPVATRFLLKRTTALGKDIWIARVGIMTLVVGAFGVGAATTGPLFIAALSLYRAEICYTPALMAIIATMTGIDGENEKHASFVYMCISFVTCVGTVISGPLLAEAFRLGLRWGGGWLGLPFFLCSVLQIFVAMILFVVRDKPRRTGLTQ